MSFEFFVLLKKKRIHFGWFFLRTCIIFRCKEPSINTKCYLHVIIASYKTWAQLWTERQGEIVKKVCYKFHQHFCKSLCFLLLLLFSTRLFKKLKKKMFHETFLLLICYIYTGRCHNAKWKNPFHIWCSMFPFTLFTISFPYTFCCYLSDIHLLYLLYYKLTTAISVSGKLKGKMFLR